MYGGYSRVYGAPQPLTVTCQAWEYLTIELTGGQKLNEYGEEGWELVSVTSPSEDYFPTAYFKRPLGYAVKAVGDAGK